MVNTLTSFPNIDCGRLAGRPRPYTVSGQHLYFICLRDDQVANNLAVGAKWYYLLLVVLLLQLLELHHVTQQRPIPSVLQGLLSVQGKETSIVKLCCLSSRQAANTLAQLMKIRSYGLPLLMIFVISCCFGFLYFFCVREELDFIAL